MSLAKIRATLRTALGVMPTLDLHGLGVKNAVAETERFLREAQEQGIPSVRIIYGKGRRSRGGHAVLKNVVPRWMDTDGRELVRRYERQLDVRGEDGGAIVWVRIPEDEEP